MRIFLLHCLCLGALLSRNLAESTITDDEEPRRTYPARRAIDGSRGRKYFVAENIDDGQFDSFGSSAGQYDPFEDETDFTDIRNNIPGEPGVDYPSYTRLPQTGFVCDSNFRGYYADEAAGCQVFHVCDGSFLVSSFLCPVGSIFSQKLLTCDWWTKVECSATRNYHVINSQSLVSEVDDDEILRKAFEMASVQSSGERIPSETVSEQRRQDDRSRRVFNYGISAVTQRGINDLQTGPDNSDYPDYPSRSVTTSKYRTSGQQLPNRQRYQEDDYYSQDVEDEIPKRNKNNNNYPKIRVHTIGEDRKNDRQGSFRNEFQPSYAPTVPTVTTTARSFYSPTIPTTFRSSTVARDSSRYDLEVESSDHLYTARGRSDETIKAATPPTVIAKNVVKSKNISSPILVNSAVEEKERLEESESSGRKIVTLPEDRTNLTKIETSTEEIVVLDDQAPENITETLSILTIDNENRDPAVFFYSRDEEETKNDNVSILKTTVNSTEASNLPSTSVDKIPAEFLEPPQKEDVNVFRIMVLEESPSSAPEIVKEVTRQEKSLKINSTAASSSHIEVPAIHITPPLLGNEQEIRESRIIRIIVNNNETSANNPSYTIAPQTSTEKAEKIDENDVAIHSRGNSAEIEKIAEVAVNKTDEAVTVEKIPATSTSAPLSTSTSTDETPFTISVSDKLRSIDINNLAALVAANEESISNDTTTTLASEETSSALSEEKGVEDREKLNHSEENLSKGEEIMDSVNDASSPVQVTLTVNRDDELDPNGDVIRKLIAQQKIGDSIGAADYKSFEIVKSEEPGALVEGPAEHQAPSSEPATNLRNDRGANPEREGRKINDDFHTNGLQSMDYYRNIVALMNGPNAPRPFALRAQQNVENVEIKTPSDAGEVSTSSPFVTIASRNDIASVTTRVPTQTTRQSIVPSSQQPELLEKSSLNAEVVQNEEVLSQLSQTFGEPESKNKKEKLIFELPHPQRSVDFKTGLLLQGADKASSSNIEDSMVNRSTEKLYVKTSVETEVIPSLSFSLNTEQEREEYMEAVMKGLLTEVQLTETTEKDTTETSSES